MLGDERDADAVNIFCPLRRVFIGTVTEVGEEAELQVVVCVDEAGEQEVAGQIDYAGRNGVRRSEEHTSELQSHLNLVCRLLLEKKKNHAATLQRDIVTSPIH